MNAPVNPTGTESGEGARPLPGKALAASLREGTRAAVEAARKAGSAPKLAVVTATDDESSAWYVRSLVSAAEKSGLLHEVVHLGPKASTEEVRDALRGLGEDGSVHGVILQTPLPPGVDARALAEAVPAAKDVDGANPLSLGRLAAGLAAFAPATAEAVIALLDHYEVPLRGARAVVVGRSTVVGKPLAHLLLGRDATVTVCHSRTRDLAEVTREADILIAAAGQPGLVTAEHVRPGAIVIDVGTNPTPAGGLTGDVDPGAARVAGALSPVPGGVGPVTTAVLLAHVVRAAQGTGIGEGLRG
ncbi:bifunctional 5,10-methylenetetrahydrofolate dehydrogenase/5,10-methenyltetrahydrofolate cyclohydrolase [Streptomyces sp. NEAU-H3]|uniref:bifunctional 5,10-methylenetetrahydrofolate dehydrogenase/5,10-methenyltetrahydrofolate cyclohydrolase n=1 Tax=Streptomyces sp. NEAU-H3 TaxID=2720636 RepID=UPI001ADB99F1|nr:bifunctional 5,10-methylenetetrahydrofolate dehydrogenase/5,10-methenyltetrahydrofolate cyclohydrolase [Streptomyces sp. NEAU-H3]